MEILNRINKACKNHQIYVIEPIGNRLDGYYGIKIILKKKEINFACDNVEIGVVMYYYGITNSYFINMVSDELRRQIDNYDRRSCIIF